MFKNLTVFMFVFVCLFFYTLGFTKIVQDHSLVKVSENKYVYQEDLIQHNLTVISKGGQQTEVIDTLSWYDPDPANLNGALPYTFPGDTVICNFKLIPDPAYLLKIRGIFGQGGGLANFYIWQDGGEYPGPTVLANTNWNVVGSTAGQETWEELDFTPTGPDTIFLPWSPDPLFENRPYFVIGYICSGTNPVQGGGEPDIYYDFNETYVRDTGPRGHSWFSYNGETWYGILYNTAQTWGQYYFEVVVNYYNGTTPFINSVSQLNDTWKTSAFETIEANLVDVDGTITESYLFYQKNNEDPDSVNYSSVAGDMYSFDIPGTYTAGDSISYWVKVTDNDGKIAIGTAKYFKVLAPANPTAPILVVFDGLTGDEVDLSLFWQPLLDAVIVDSLGLQYEGWNVQEHRGIDNSITDYQSFEHALVVGFSVASVPAEDYTNSVWKNFVDAGKNLLIASSDYLFQNNVPENFTPTAGDFAYDILGVGKAVNDPNNGADPPLSSGDQYIVGVQGDPITGNWSGWPITFNFDALLSGQNWNDYASADPGNPNAATIFTGAVSDSGNGVRNIRANNGISVYLTFNLSAMADTNDVGDPYILPDAYQLLYNILHYFQNAVNSINYNNLTNAITYELKANYPNPFNPSTNIEYSLKNTSEVSLVIYNLLGEKVRTLVNETQAADRYRITWDGTNDIGLKVASGIYIYKLTAGNFTDSQKMILMK